MKTGYPCMGYSSLSFKMVLRNLGASPISPPPITKKTFKLGMKNSPESICLQFKLMLGTYIELLDKGADTLLIMSTYSHNACQYAHFPFLMERILREMGYKFEMLKMGISDEKESMAMMRKAGLKKSRSQIYREFMNTAYQAYAIKEIELLASKVRASEENRGEARKVESEAMSWFENSSTVFQTNQAKKQAEKDLNSIKQDKSINPARIAIVGDLLTISEPKLNLDIIRRTGEMGIYMEQSRFLSDIYENMLLRNWRKDSITSSNRDAAKYIPYGFGGANINAIAEAVRYKKKGFDAMIHLYTMSCMPETLVKGMLPTISKNLRMPIISIAIDEQTTDNGLYTKVEAFLDMLKRE